MSNVHTKQLESEIHMKLSEIIAGLDNETAAQATVTEVILNGDNSIAKVYVSFMKENDESSYFELKKAASFIRRELAYMLSIKKVPFVEFVLDDKLERMKEMEQLIKNAK